MITFSQNQNEQKALDELLFAGKNKAYGAYSLRAEADYYLKKALFSGVAVFGVFIGGTYAYLQTKKVHITTNKGVEIELKPIEPVIKEDKIVKPIVPKVQSVKEVEKTVEVKTVDTRVPTPTANPPTETPLPSVKTLQTAASGFENKEGIISTTSIAPTKPNIGNGTITNNTAPEVVKPNNAIETVVDEDAVFMGGIDSFRAQVGENFDYEAMAGEEGLVKAMVTFVVERDGTITNVKAEGQTNMFNKEAEKAIKSVKGKWTPAKIKGEAVRSYFRIPVSIKFE
ncbi:energy transducer TonB [Riemerella anatipestifer]|uniref:energy transducer TonB n=1 Tax=Riemerella anatipestifer TaxID=34085 RepID=UPI0021D5FBB6|nr:energy transducer TonB [Riemerella anatipestifer]MCU7543397.1 energy transducer TonB [Riemerella anatipestifer]MCW0514208.1 energy transducer TonB [Riemerella anatipestifer]